MTHTVAASVELARIRPTLAGRVVRRAELTAREIEAMYRLLAEHFSGVEVEIFRQDLAEKNWVVLLEDDRRNLKGFSTFLMYTTTACGRPTTVVYSGDTIVDPSAWGSPALPRAWIHAVYALRRDYPDGELYWLLLTSGFRTYRFMSVFYRRFHPCFDEPTPADAQRILDALSIERFGQAYDVHSGIVRFPQPQMLREGLSDVPDGRCADPHVRFFLGRNPGHASGDELVSLISLAPDNLTPAGRRMVR